MSYLMTLFQLVKLFSNDGDERTSRYEGVFKSFWTGHLQQELQMVQLSATRCSCSAIL